MPSQPSRGGHIAVVAAQPISVLKTGKQAVNPLVVLIRSQPGMADRLLAEHADDGSGRCRLCSSGAQAGRYQFPCAIQRAATEACEQSRGDGTVVGDSR